MHLLSFWKSMRLFGLIFSSFSFYYDFFSFYALELDVVFLFASDSKLLLVHLWFGKKLRYLLFSSFLCFSLQLSVLHYITSSLSFHRKAWQGTLCDLPPSLKQAVISIPPPLRREREWMLPRGIHILCHKANYIKLCRRVFADEFFSLRFFQPSLKKFFFKRFFKNPFNFSNLGKKSRHCIEKRSNQLVWNHPSPNFNTNSSLSMPALPVLGHILLSS